MKSKSAYSLIIVEKEANGEMIIEKNIMINSRDGCALATDIYRPKLIEKYPALVARTPYDKNQMSHSVAPYVEAGYAVIIQDVRGRFASEGCFYPYAFEVSDALDLYNWISNQEWYSGNIGTFGGSYLGGTQLLPAGKSPEDLKAMIPEITFDNFYSGCAYQGGVKVMHDLVWTVRSIIPDILNRKNTQAQLPTVDDALNQLPLADHETIRKFGSYYHDWLEHPTDGPFWQETSPSSSYERIKAPALHISGWYDIFVPSTLNNYLAMKTRAGSKQARQNTRLIMGPWTHLDFSGRFTDFSFGENSSEDAIDLVNLKINWFDYWLKNQGELKGAPVKLFVMGSNKWRDEDEWPLSNATYSSYYLNSGGSANSLYGDGLLQVEIPEKEAKDQYIFDPFDPVSTVGGQVILPDIVSGPADQQFIEQRNDLLVYTSPVLTEPLEVIGEIVLKLYVSSDCLDTDFTAKLVDVFPDGRAMNLTDGVLRARYRDSFKEPQLMNPHEVYELTIDVGATANVFLPGHKIRIEVSSSNFPKFSRNSNSGKAVFDEKACDYQKATNTIYHGGNKLSRLLLPIVK